MAEQRQRENVAAAPVAPQAAHSKRTTPKAPMAKAPTPKAPTPKVPAEEAPSADGVKLYKGMRVGSRAQVWHGTADITAPSKKGLKKTDLTMNPRGHIVSKKQRAAGTKAFERLRELGYAPVAGKPFVAFTKKNAAPKKSASRKQRDSRKSRKQRDSRNRK